MSVLIAAILLAIVQIVGWIGFCWWLRLILNAKQAEIEARLEDAVTRFVAPRGTPEAPEPSELGVLVSQLGETVGAAAGRSFKASIMADSAHLKHWMNAAGQDGALAAITEKQPGIGGVLGAMKPSTRKGLLGNPIMQLVLGQLMQGLGAGGTGNGNDGMGAAGASVRERLKKGG